MNDVDRAIERFLTARLYAVAGASKRREKYGNKIFRRILQSGRECIPLNPIESEIEGHAAYASLRDLPRVPESLSIVTPAEVTRRVVQDAIAMGVSHIWMQPGAEDEEASQAARDAGLVVIDDGSCILIALSGF